MFKGAAILFIQALKSFLISLISLIETHSFVLQWSESNSFWFLLEYQNESTVFVSSLWFLFSSSLKARLLTSNRTCLL